MQLELHQARGGLTDVKTVIAMTPSEYNTATAYEYVEFAGVVYKNFGSKDAPQFLSVHPFKIGGA